MVDLSAERDVAPGVAEVPHVRRRDDDEHEDGGAQPRQERGGALPSADDPERRDRDQPDEIQGAFGPDEIGEPQAETGERDQRARAGPQPSPRGQDARDQEERIGGLAQHRGRVLNQTRMNGDEHRGQKSRVAADDAPGERERGHDHRRSEEGGDQTPRHLPVADERLGERDTERVERMEKRVEGRAGRLELPRDRHVGDAVRLDHGEKLGDEEPDRERGGGNRQRQDHAPPRASVS